MINAGSANGLNQYMYTDGNPVGYVDPSGHSKTSSGVAGMIHSFNKWVKEVVHHVNHLDVAKEYNHAKQQNDKAASVNTFIQGGAEGATAFFVLDGLAKKIGKPKKRMTVPGHIYSGDGNHDTYSGFFDNGGNGKYTSRILLGGFAQAIFQALKIDNKDNKYVDSYLTILPGLRTRPKSFMDRVAQRHDSEVYGKWFGHSKNRSGGAHYYKSWGDGLVTGKDGFYEQPIDSIFVGFVGSVAFALEDLSYNFPNIRL